VFSKVPVYIALTNTVFNITLIVNCLYGQCEETRGSVDCVTLVRFQHHFFWTKEC
jgi:hypothetical protein